jgi:hypothetical protein
LFSNGSLEYYEPEKKNLKGSINLTIECKAVLNDDYKFDILTKTRRYVFILKQKSAKLWVEKINRIIDGLNRG